MGARDNAWGAVCLGSMLHKRLWVCGWKGISHRVCQYAGGCGSVLWVARKGAVCGCGGRGLVAPHGPVEGVGASLSTVTHVCCASGRAL